MRKDKQISPARVEDVLKFCVLFMGEDELQDLIKKNYDPSRSVSDFAGIIKENSMPATFVTDDFLELAIKTYVDILEDKKREDCNISLRSISLDTDTDQEDTSSIKSGNIKLVPLSKLKSDKEDKKSSEYIEYEYKDDSNLLLESKVEMSDAERKNKELKREAACVWHEPVNQEKAENKNEFQLPQNSLDLLPEPCPLQAPEMFEEEDDEMISLPSPCASVLRTGGNPNAEVETSRCSIDENVEIQSKPNQEAKSKSCMDEASADKPAKERRVRKRITMSGQSERSEGPELASPKRIVIETETDEPEPVSCPHFEASDQRQITCFYCNSIKKGRARCQNISHVNNQLSQEQGVCKFELINQDGCQNLECARAHFAPNDLHLEPLPFCLDFLRNICVAECKRPHHNWKKVEKILAKAVNSLFKSCDICLANFTEDRDELLRQQNKSKVTKSRKRPPPERRNTEVEMQFAENEEGPPLKRKICKHFLEGTCMFGSSCWKFHDVSGMDLRKKISRN